MKTPDQASGPGWSGRVSLGLLSLGGTLRTSGAGETITRLSYTAVKDEFVNLNVSHAILFVVVSHGCRVMY
jgi:Na+/serine symporter